MAQISPGDVFYAIVRSGKFSQTIFGKQLADCKLGPFTAVRTDAGNVYALDRIFARTLFTFTRKGD